MVGETTTSTVVAVLTPVLSLAGAAIGAAALLWNNTRNIKGENITKDRAKWRDNVRQRSLDVHKAAVSKNAVWLDELHLEFSLILNPTDEKNRAILEMRGQFELANHSNFLLRASTWVTERLEELINRHLRRGFDSLVKQSINIHYLGPIQCVRIFTTV
jgi:hypothetical protein